MTPARTVRIAAAGGSTPAAPGRRDNARRRWRHLYFRALDTEGRPDGPAGFHQGSVMNRTSPCRALRHLAFCLSAAATLTWGAPLGAQTPLGTPESVFPEDFGTIQTVRELPDGRVLVADPTGRALYLVDMEEGTRTQVGREGQGPDEYKQPDAVWPLPGDSTLLVDLGNGRLVALGPDLSFGPTMPIGLTEPRPDRPLVLALPQGVDGQGNLYARLMGGAMRGGELPDSAAIIRIDRATRETEVVASFKLTERRRVASGTGGNENVSITNVPLSGEDAWGVAPDGSVVIARVGDYHLERIAPDGSVTRGPAVPFDPVRIGTDEKEEWVAESGRSGGGIGIGVTIENGQVSMSFARGMAGTRREIDQYEWPAVKPPFYQGRIPIDPLGRAWIRRHVDAGGPSTYDVFDARGVRETTYTLDNGKRIVGFGDGWVYVVSFDEFDLNYLERYRMPGGASPTR